MKFSSNSFVTTVLLLSFLFSCSDQKDEPINSALDVNKKESTIKKAIEEVHHPDEPTSDTLIIEYPYADSSYFIESNYLNGVRVGISRTYDKSFTRPKYMSYYENGEELWMTFPSTNMKTTLNHGVMGKGAFIFEDSVYMVAPYKSGNSWYEGLFINKEEKGIHRVYRESGTLKFEAIYSEPDSVQISEFNESGDTIRTSTVKRY